MTLPAALQWGLIAVVLVGGILAERLVERTEPLVTIPRWAQVLLLGSAIGGPWLLYFAELVPTTAVDATVATLGLSAVLYLAVGRTVGIGSGPAGTC